MNEFQTLLVLAGVFYLLTRDAGAATGPSASPTASLFARGVDLLEAPFSDTISAETQRFYLTLSNQIGRQFNLNPRLIWALAQQESKWGAGLNPAGPGGTGDAGHGHGIMQIDDRWHGPWLSTNDWTDPYVNLTYAIGSVLLPVRKQLAAQGLSGVTLDQATICAYNAGVPSTLRGLSEGDMQRYTAHNDEGLGYLDSVKLALNAVNVTAGV